MLVSIALFLFVAQVKGLLQHGVLDNKMPSTDSTNPSSLLNAQRYQTHADDDTESDQDYSHVCNLRRRRVMIGIVGNVFGGVLLARPSSTSAGEVGARITEAVTQSDLGVSVRTSVVRGAQVMDRLDGKWEQFSDKFGLGSERSKQGGRPSPKIIPNPKPLDSTTAQSMIQICDTTFCQLTGVTPKELQNRINKIDTLVRPSFERSGLKLPSADFDCSKSIDVSTGDLFNYVSYLHFKAYGDTMVESKQPFPPFYRDFQQQVGQELLKLLLVVGRVTSPSSTSKQAALAEALAAVDSLANVLVQKGLVAATESSAVDQDRISDWVDDLGEYQFSLALDGDVTLGAQILLQEQGFRLYPNYGRFVVAALLQNKLPLQKIVVDEYYMDTDYNSNPDLFQVKENLLNVVLENP